MTVGMAVPMTAPAMAAMTVAVAAVTVGVTMNMRMAVPLRMTMDRGFVAIGQRHADHNADRDPDRQRAVVIGPRRRCGQNSNEKRYEEECAHPVSSFCHAGKPYAD